MPPSLTRNHQHASGLIPSTYTEWRVPGKLKKITQRLYFGYCQEGFREFLEEKCENRKFSGQGFEVRGQQFYIPLILAS